MTAAWVTVAVLLLGVPLAAWWLGGCRFWSRLRPRSTPDPWGDAMHRFGLTPGEMARVESAVVWGVQLDGERLRRAAVALGREELARRRFRSPRTRRAFGLVLLLVLGGAIVLYAREPDQIPWGLLLLWVVTGPVSVRMARGPRRAVELNSEPLA